MTWMTDFSTEEWALVRDLPLMVTIALISSDQPHLGEVQDELHAAYAAIARVEEHGSESGLVRAVAADLAADQPSEKPPKPAPSGGDPVEGCALHCAHVRELLDARCQDAEIDAFTRWVVSIGHDVAAARVERRGQTAVSASEQEALERITTALGLDVDATSS